MRCPDFCFNYGVIGHTERNCKEKGTHIGREPQFGTWLKTSNPRSPAKKQDRSGQHEDDPNERATNTQNENRDRNISMIT